jgi:hydrid cluster protein-associated redox disulfide domain
MRRNHLEDMSVKEIMDRWPSTVPLFIRKGLKCPGCPIGPFHTLDEAAREHGKNLSDLIEEIQRLSRSQ